MENGKIANYVRIQNGARSATKKAGHVPAFFNKQENPPKTKKFSGDFSAIALTGLPGKGVSR